LARNTFALMMSYQLEIYSLLMGIGLPSIPFIIIRAIEPDLPMLDGKKIWLSRR